tara:strand:- start:207885 stop:208676 length:792 start_codon:yes stop_codon:yes gene_type:complete
MLYPRIIPCLLIHNKGLVKTVKFKSPKYVGDPLNAVKIFNEKEVDELMILDIDATINDVEPNYRLIAKIAAECRMPLSYGGGIKTSEQAKTILSLGVEKIALSSALIEQPTLATKIAAQVGAQSVVAVLDVRKKRFGHKYDIYTHNGKNKDTHELVKLIKQLEQNGIGELVINSIDHDGVMKGFDLELIRIAKSAVDIPVTVLGGAGSLDDIGKVIQEHKIIGVAAGSLFVFKGPYKAVLINYPSQNEKLQLINQSLPKNEQQ